MDVDIKVVAYSFPAIALVLGFLLLLTGASSNNPDLTRWGGIFVVIGIIAYIIPILISVLGD
jgi:hypothetical protein